MPDQYFLERFTRRDASIRAADADRERTAGRLRTAHTEGRLDVAEFQERIDRCYEAKTLGQLGELVRDLPREERAQRSASAWLRPSRWTAVPLAWMLLALIAITAVSGRHVVWLWIPLLFIFWRVSWWRRRRWWADARHGWDEPI